MAPGCGAKHLGGSLEVGLIHRNGLLNACAKALAWERAMQLLDDLEAAASMLVPPS